MTKEIIGNINEFESVEVSESGKTVKVYDKDCPVPSTYKVEEGVPGYGGGRKFFKITDSIGQTVVYFLDK